MKKLYFIFLFLVIVSINSFAQKVKQDSVEYFIYLSNGKLLSEGDFSIKKGIFRNKFRDKHGKKIKRMDIKFYRDSKGYFGSLVKKTIFGKDFSTLIPRVETGVFDIFREIEKSGYVGNDGYYHSSGSLKTYYYAKGFGDLKNLTYDNLIKDLCVEPNSLNNPQCTDILNTLEKGKKRRKTTLILLGTGITTMIVGGIIAKKGTGQPSKLDPLFQTEGNTKIQNRGLIISAVGFSVVVSSIVWPKSRKKYLEALRAYNKQFK